MMTMIVHVVADADAVEETVTKLSRPKMTIASTHRKTTSSKNLERLQTLTKTKRKKSVHDGADDVDEAVSVRTQSILMKKKSVAKRTLMMTNRKSAQDAPKEGSRLEIVTAARVTKTTIKMSTRKITSTTKITTSDHDLGGKSSLHGPRPSALSWMRTWVADHQAMGVVVEVAADVAAVTAGAAKAVAAETAAAVRAVAAMIAAEAETTKPSSPNARSVSREFVFGVSNQ